MRLGIRGTCLYRFTVLEPLNRRLRLALCFAVERGRVVLRNCDVAGMLRYPRGTELSWKEGNAFQLIFNTIEVVNILMEALGVRCGL